MKSKMTMGTKLMGGTAVLFVLAALLGYSGLSTAARFKSRFDETVDRNIKKIALVDQIGLANSELISSQRAVILAAFAKDDAELGKYEQAFRHSVEIIRKSQGELQPLVVTQEGRDTIADIATQLSDWMPHFEEVVREAGAGHAAEANRIRKEVTAPLYQRINADATRIQALQAEVVAKDKVTIDSENALSQTIAWSLLVLFVIAGVVVIMVVRSVTGEVRKAATQLAEGAEQVASAAVQVSSASQSLAQGSSEQASSLEETSASSEEINSMTRKNAENSRTAADLVTHSGQRFEEANQKLDQLVAAMAEINSQSDKISKIIKVIDEIAFQTNILALNAAVEAARAGEAGMGFAVVADEVRNLAQRCAQAAKDTAALIEDSVAKSAGGQTRVDEVAAVVRAVSAEAVKVKTLVDEVNLGSQEQARGIDQISKAIVQMEQVTQKNAANAEESASASEELSAQAETMKAVVSHLEAMVGGNDQLTSHPASVRESRPKSASSAPKIGTAARSLKALQSAVSSKKPVAQPVPVMACKVDRTSIPLDEDFKEF